MAIFKVPKITTSQRLNLTLDASEIVYDSDTGVYYGGNGITLGGYPLGTGSTSRTETFIVTEQNILDKHILLSAAPTNPSASLLVPEGGIPQRYGVDFIIDGNLLSWNTLGLDNFLEIGEVLTVSY